MSKGCDEQAWAKWQYDTDILINYVMIHFWDYYRYLWHFYHSNWLYCMMFLGSSLDVQTGFGTNSENINIMMQIMYQITCAMIWYFCSITHTQWRVMRNKEVELKEAENKKWEKEISWKRGHGELGNVHEFWKYEGSSPYCRCSAISLRPDISHINHFSQIDTEQDEALLPLPHPNAWQHWEWAWAQAWGWYTLHLPVFRSASPQTSGKSFQKRATHDPLLYCLS